MLTEKIAWQAVSCLFTLNDSNKAISVLDAVFKSIQYWSFERPSDLYSALLRAFLRAGKTWSGLGDFLAWWQLSNLRSEDYLPSLTNDGKKMMSTAEQAYIAYAKQVLERQEPVAIRALISELEVLHEHHPEYQYPPYYQAKLLVATGSKDEAMTALLPFARRKQSEFWMWDLLSELYNNESEKSIACLCRAVTCQTQEKFLVNARLNLARKLNVAGRLNEALTELTMLIKARQQEGWNVTTNLTDGVDKLSSKGATVLVHNKALYRQYRPLADELLYADIPEQVGVVTFINADKKIAHFSISRTVSGHFKYEGSMARAQPGDFVAVRIEERSGKDGIYWVPLSVKPTSQTPSNEVFKSFSGTLRRKDGKEFGFVNDVFVTPTLLKQLPTDQNITVSGAALLSFDKVKQAYSWKAITAKTVSI
jgi:hypothetical protein